MSLRERIVECIFNATVLGRTNGEMFKMGDRFKIGKVMALLVPSRILTRDMLYKGVSSFMQFFDDYRTDYPTVRFHCLPPLAPERKSTL